MEYRVFTKKGCGTCKSVLALLNSKQVSYTEIDVGTDTGMELAQQLGINSAGTVIDENNNIILFADLSKTIAANRECESCQT